MGNLKLIWSIDAKQDIQDLHAYFLRTSNPANAKEVVRRIRKSALLLVQFPKLGKTIAYSQRLQAEIRMILSGRIKIFYLQSGTEIHLVRIWDGKQDPRGLVL